MNECPEPWMTQESLGHHVGNGRTSHSIRLALGLRLMALDNVGVYRMDPDYHGFRTDYDLTSHGVWDIVPVQKRKETPPRGILAASAYERGVSGRKASKAPNPQVECKSRLRKKRAEPAKHAVQFHASLLALADSSGRRVSK